MKVILQKDLNKDSFSKTMKTPEMFKQKKFIYHFGSSEETEGSCKMKNLLGGKGANLAEMAQLGLPVPPGFTLSTELCHLFYNNSKTLKNSWKQEIRRSIKKLESQLGKKFGDPKNPLLLSVRSGAPISMPGMMDTILNLGLNAHTLQGLIQKTQNPRFAWDTYRRFIQMYSNVVMGMNPSLLEVYLEDYKNKKSYKEDSDMQPADWEKIVSYFKNIILQDTGQAFPEDPEKQLWSAIQSVFLSWNNPRALVYRQRENAEDTGTAVNVQSMVFGNQGDYGATGVVFTRNPSTGEKELFGEFLVNAQGEDIVAGVRTPQLIINKKSEAKSLKACFPEAFSQLLQLANLLEKHYRNMQDIEFTIENNKLWLLQTRNGKCTAQAQLKIAFDLIDEGLINEKEAVGLVSPRSLEALLHPSLDSSSSTKILAKGLPASPGGAVGRIIFSSEDAVEWNKKGTPVILVRTETSPEDINGMISSKGILTARGGMTSHAAVVARSMGKPCIVGCEYIHINIAKKEVQFKNTILKEGDDISINGTTGEILEGAIKTKAPQLNENFFKLMKLADKYTKMEVRSNADTPQDAETSKKFGAKGIGLCRTEHMFFAPDRIDIMRKMIMADDTEERQNLLNELFPYQKEDFYQVLKIMNDLPVTIRFLDPPLHEFLPSQTEEIKELAEKFKWETSKLQNKIEHLKEINPMLGHRGCRLAITFPEIYKMQARAVAEATARLKKENKKPKSEIMIPLVALPEELSVLKTMIQEEIKKVEEAFKVSLFIPIGTMIELPRACLQAGEIAKTADFFSFGTNDLTQTTLGISRDDSNRFLASYVNQKLIPKDPFHSLDKEGVGELLKIAISKGRAQKHDIKIGICGEHGGDASSIEFFNTIGLDYVSCSPYRLPVARLSAAQEALKEKSNEN